MTIKYDIIKKDGGYELVNMKHTELFHESTYFNDCLTAAFERTPYETYVYFNGYRIASRCVEDDSIEGDNKIYLQDHREMVRQQMIDVLKKYKGEPVSAKTIWMIKRDMKEMFHQNGYYNDSSSFVEVAFVRGYATVYHPVTDIEVSTL